jgi:hypothetical protein
MYSIELFKQLVMQNSNLPKGEPKSSQAHIDTYRFIFSVSIDHQIRIQTKNVFGALQLTDGSSKPAKAP